MDQLVYIVIVKSGKCHAVYRRYFCKQQQPLFCCKSTSAQEKIQQVYFCDGKDHVKVFGGTGNGEIFKHRGRGLTAPCGRDRRKRTEEQDTALLLYPESYRIAEDVCKSLGKSLGKKLDPIEIGYLAMHIERTVEQ